MNGTCVIFCHAVVRNHHRIILTVNDYIDLVNLSDKSMRVANQGCEGDEEMEVIEVTISA